MMIFVGKSFKVESLAKTFASSIVVYAEEFQLSHKALLFQSMYKPWIIGCRLQIMWPYTHQYIVPLKPIFLQFYEVTKVEWSKLEGL
jgi:hypothetical protein